ncbi:MAG: ATP synthase F1 subunit delta [Syntrophorhabdaceae bacterium]|nr:ATP synthase F1 subunit delta [Syntrophorhabdaceae bacterium]
MIAGSLARRYARALFDIGKEEGQVRRSLSEVEEFSKVLDSSAELREAMESAHVSRQAKQAALESLLSSTGFLPATKSFLSLLVEKGRMNVLPSILVELRLMVEEYEGIERAVVTVPMELSVPQKDLLRAVLEKRTGKKILLDESVDPAVIGGMIVRVGSTVYDGSIRTQIQQLRQNLQKG